MFKWLEQRKQAQQIERDIKVRQGKKRIRKHIEQQQRMQRKLWALGKRALQLDDQAQFSTIGKQILWTRNDISRWQRYALSLETLEARRDQVLASAEFMTTLQSLADSMLAGANPQALIKTQADIEKGLARAQSLDERLSMFMDMADDMVFSLDLSDVGDLHDIEAALRDDVRQLDSHTDLDAAVEAGLAGIRAKLEGG